MNLHLRAYDRVRLGKMLNPVRGFLDASAALAALLGAGVLWVAGAGDLSRRMSLLVFGATMVGLYTVSALYHSVPWRDTWKARMQRLDHSMIFLLVAGTYTPLAVVVLDGWLRMATFAVIWGITLVGIGQKLLLPKVKTWFTVTMSTTQGWLALLLLVPLSQVLPWPALGLALLGGVLYTVGMIFLVTERPRLWPRVFSYHESMHVLVIGGSLCHWLMTLRYVAHHAPA